MTTFSKRYGYLQEVEITLREDAPSGLRRFIIDIAEEDCDLNPSYLRTIICRVLNESPDPKNWSDYPNIDDEVRYLIGSCDGTRSMTLSSAYTFIWLNIALKENVQLQKQSFFKMKLTIIF